MLRPQQLVCRQAEPPPRLACRQLSMLQHPAQPSWPRHSSRAVPSCGRLTVCRRRSPALLTGKPPRLARTELQQAYARSGDWPSRVSSLEPGDPTGQPSHLGTCLWLSCRSAVPSLAQLTQDMPPLLPAAQCKPVSHGCACKRWLIHTCSRLAQQGDQHRQAREALDLQTAQLQEQLWDLGQEVSSQCLLIRPTADAACLEATGCMC